MKNQNASSEKVQSAEGYFPGNEKTDLYFQRWKFGDQPRRVIILTHGLGEHSDAYQRLVMSAGFQDSVIFGWDLRGHGKSDGRWGVIDKFDTYCHDLKSFVQFVKKQMTEMGYPNIPTFLLGHSMGGLVTTRMLLREGNDLDLAGIILSSPLFKVAIAVPPLKEKAGRFFAQYFPNLTLHNEIKNDDLTRDRAIVHEYDHDTMRHNQVSLGLFMGLNESMDWAMAHASEFKWPLLLQQAGSDHIVSAQASQKFFSLVSSTDKELKVYERYYHEIYNDVGREIPYRDLISWLEKRSPK